MKNLNLTGLAILAIASLFASCTKEDSNPIFSSETTSLQTTTEKYIVVLKDTKGASTLSANEVKNEAVSVTSRIGVNDMAIKQVYNSVLNGFSAELTKSQADALKNDPRVGVVEKDAIATVQGNVESVVSTKSATTLAQSTPWGVTAVGGYTNATASTGVAWIVDTGIELTHPDLNVDVTRSRTFVKTGADATNLSDLNGHGTHVAGTIAAKNNTIGVVGVSAGASVISIKVLNSGGSGYISDIIEGLNYISNNLVAGKLNVVNMSLGGSTSTALDNAVLSLAAKGAKIVIAAGNNSSNANNFSPSRVNHSNVYTISAFDVYGAFSTFSNFANGPIDFSAPGRNVLSTYKGGTYSTMSGTSMAAPHVAGILLANNGVINSNGKVTGDVDSTADVKAKR